MKIYFVRHGQTDLNKNGQIQGRLDVDMNLVGFKQARLCAKRLTDVTFDFAFTSPQVRAIHTAEEILRDKDVVIHKHLDIQDTDVGQWEGLKWSEVIKKHWHNEVDFNKIIKARGGETFVDISERVERFIKEISVLNADNILVVSHAAVVYAAVKFVLGIPKDKRVNLKCDNTGISIIEQDKSGRWHIRTLNDIAHLEKF